MADTILEVLKNLLAAEAHIHVAGPEYVKARDAAIAAIAALAVEPPAPAEHVATLHVSDFRGYENYDFQHLVDLPPGHYKLFTACTAQPPAPAPAADGERDHVPGAGNMVPAAYAARLRQCPTHGQLPANAWGCPECLRELREELAKLKAPAADAEEREAYAQWLDGRGAMADLGVKNSYFRAAALLRQLPPEGLSAEEYYHIDSGARIVREPCDGEPGGCWTVRNSRHVSPCTEFRTVADAVAALQQARRQEVGDE